MYRHIIVLKFFKGVDRDLNFPPNPKQVTIQKILIANFWKGSVALVWVRDWTIVYYMCSMKSCIFMYIAQNNLVLNVEWIQVFHYIYLSDNHRTFRVFEQI